MPVVGEKCDADAGFGVHVFAADFDRLGEGFHEIAGDAFGIAARLQLVRDYDELVAAVPGAGIDLAHTRCEPLGNVAQEPIARAVAEGIVDRLEAIEIDRKERELETVPPSAFDRGVEAFLEHAPVRQTGQFVVLCQEDRTFHLLLEQRENDADGDDVFRDVVGGIVDVKVR